MTFKEVEKKLISGGVEYDLTYRQLNLIAAATNSKEFLTTWDLLKLEDLELTSEPIEGTLLMQLRRSQTFSFLSLTCYDAVQSSTVCVNICADHLVRLFGEIPNSLYVTKKETQNE